MHISPTMRRAAALLVATLLSAGTIASAADSDKKAAPAAAPASAQNPPAVVARVNGVDIKEIDLRRAKKVIMSARPGVEIPPERQKEFDQQALAQLISAELLYQAGQKLTVKELEKKVDEKLAQGRARFSSEEAFAKAVRDLEMNESELREFTRKDLIISNFIEQTILPTISVSEEESKKFYDQNQDKFKRGESVRASHILVGVDAKATPEEKKKAREKAEKLRKDLAGGADFSALAKDNSTCPSSKQGGDLGYFGKGQMVPAFEQAAFALKPGEISDVVETQFGYHIIKLAEKKDAQAVLFSEARPRIEDYLKNQKIQAAVSAYLAEARKGAKMEMLLK